MPVLNRLNCCCCKKLTILENMPDLARINCSECISLNTFPMLNNIRELNCNNCINIEAIPFLAKLTKLYCNACPKIKNIYIADGVKEIHCNNCDMLTTIFTTILNVIEPENKSGKSANVTKLKILQCSESRLLTFIPDGKSLEKICCKNCPWLECKQNTDFKNNLNKLVKAQNIIRRFLKRKYIKNYLQSEAFVAWYYGPYMPGGKKAKKELENIISDLS